MIIINNGILHLVAFLLNVILSLFLGRIESLIQSQARELCELREQIRVSRGLGVEQRKQLLELRGALEELLEPNNMHSAQGTQLREQLDHSLSLPEKLEQGKYTQTHRETLMKNGRDGKL